MRFYFLIINFLIFSLQKFLILAQSCESEMNWGNQNFSYFTNRDNVLYKFVTDYDKNSTRIRDSGYSLDPYEFRQKFISYCLARASSNSSNAYANVFSDRLEFEIQGGGLADSYNILVNGYAKLCRENLSVASMEFEQCIRKTYDSIIRNYPQSDDFGGMVFGYILISIGTLFFIGLGIWAYLRHTGKIGSFKSKNSGERTRMKPSKFHTSHVEVLVEIEPMQENESLREVDISQQALGEQELRAQQITLCMQKAAVILLAYARILCITSENKNKKSLFSKLPFEMKASILSFLDETNLLTSKQINQIIEFASKKITLGSAQGEFYKSTTCEHVLLKYKNDHYFFGRKNQFELMTAEIEMPENTFKLI